ncbi:MAG: M48 family metallopeptidase [Phycisphaerales bacterium]
MTTTVASGRRTTARMPRHRFAILSIAASGVLVGLAMPGCRTVEGSGRQQLVLMSVDQERRMGAEAYPEILAEQGVIATGAQVDRVRRVGADLAAAASRRFPQSSAGMDWAFTVVDEPTVNAWALPGGKCGVNLGLLEFVENDDELAVVIGHEIAHALASHGAERLSRDAVAGILAELALGEIDPGLRFAIEQAYGVGVSLPFSRDHEREADRLGLFLAAEAGYDPRAAVSLWRRMAADGGQGPEWLSTHPDPGGRADELERLIPEAEAIRRAAPAPADRP